MTNNTATQINSAAIEVIAHGSEYIVSFLDELRTELTAEKAQSLLAELDAIATTDSQWLEDNFDSDDYSEAPLYAVRMFEQ